MDTNNEIVQTIKKFCTEFESEYKTLYISMPITSGQESDRRRAQVSANVVDNWVNDPAHMWRCNVIVPQRLKIESWSEDEYMSFWTETIKMFRPSMLALKGWNKSIGCRQEIELALKLGLPVYTEFDEPFSGILGHNHE